MKLLSVDNLSASYGTIQALFDVSFEIEEGQLTALMGRNGMGKSTTVKCICRMMPASGSLIFDQQDLSRISSYRAARLGIGLVPEGRRCFTNLTVRENLIAAARPGFWTIDKARELFPRLEERQSQSAASLSGGEQQMLAIARALMTNPRLLILDEATEGLAPIIRQEIWQAIDSLKQRTGLSILVIDKSVRELKNVAENVVILEKGRSAWHGSINELSADITERYLGI